MEDSKINEYLERFSPPNQFDEAVYNTRCHVSTSKETYDLYVQMSQDSEKPRWVLLETNCKY